MLCEWVSPHKLKTSSLPTKRTSNNKIKSISKRCKAESCIIYKTPVIRQTVFVKINNITDCKKLLFRLLSKQWCQTQANSDNTGSQANRLKIEYISFPFITTAHSAGTYQHNQTAFCYTVHSFSSDTRQLNKGLTSFQLINAQ